MSLRLVCLSLTLNLVLGCSTTKSAGPTITTSVAADVLAANPFRNVVVEVAADRRPEASRGERLVLFNTTSITTFVNREDRQQYDWLGKPGRTTPEFGVANRDVVSLSVNNHGLGALIGLGIGAAVTAVVVAEVAASYHPSNDAIFNFSRGETAAFTAVVVGAPVILTSTLLGGIIGFTTHYQFR